MKECNTIKDYYINENNANQRLDRYICKLFPKLHKGLIQKHLRKGRVKVNGRRIKDGKHKLLENDKITLFFDANSEQRRIGNIDTEPIREENIIYEDKHVLSVYKRSGIVMHSEQHSLDNKVIAYLLKKERVVDGSFKIQHLYRLDKNTSGIVMYPKTKTSYDFFDKAFKEGNVIKKYRATTTYSDKFSEDNDYVIEKGIVYDNGQFQYIDNEEGKMSKIIVRKLKDIGKKFSILDITNVTGRKHQIRILLMSEGCKIINDQKYGIGDTRFGKTMKLKCYKIVFTEPNNINNYKLTFSLNK